MKVLTASQMREVDRRTIEAGIPGIVLMENAGQRMVDVLAREFAPLASQRIVVFCGKGNNGGDGLVIARQLFTRFRPAALHVLLAVDPLELRGDAAENCRMWIACGGNVAREIAPEMRHASLIVDALLGTGLAGPPAGLQAQWIAEINRGFPLAKVAAVDIPSGMLSDCAPTQWECARADWTVTFTAPKLAHALAPCCDRMGKIEVVPIGTPDTMLDDVTLAVSESADFSALAAPRPSESNKGSYGHVLVIAGAPGKTGAASMSGIAALRAGAGLVTVAAPAEAIAGIAAHAPELMSEPLPPNLDRKTVVAIGPGLGMAAQTVEMVRHLFSNAQIPMVVDADALNALAGSDFQGGEAFRVLTPHPGEMARLCWRTVAAVQADRLGVARGFAKERNVCVVLKGHRSLIAMPDGRVWINPTGSPAMSTAGSGDILTGLVAGLLAQFPDDPGLAVRAAVWLHGRAGELGAVHWGEKSLIATDLLQFLPEALRECARFPHRQ